MWAVPQAVGNPKPVAVSASTRMAPLRWATVGEAENAVLLHKWFLPHTENWEIEFKEKY